MIPMRNFFPAITPLKLQQLQRWSDLQQDQLNEAIYLTKDCVLGFLKRQLEKGHWKEVRDVLKGKPMTKAGKGVYVHLSNYVVANLMQQLKLRKLVALGIVVVLLPLAIAKLGDELVNMVWKKE